MLESLVDRRLPPAEVALALGALPRDGAGEVHQPFGGVLPAVEDDVLHQLQQVLGNVVVQDQLAGVDDAHVEAGLGGVEEESGVHRLPHAVVAPEGEGEVGDAAGDAHPGAAFLDLGGGGQEGLGVAVVLLDPGGYGQDVGIEDYVLSRKADLLSEQLVGALADEHLALGGVSLALLVEGHHDHGGAEAADLPSLFQEGLLALFEADRVGDALALQALEPGLQHGPTGAVDHDREPGHLGLGRQQVQEGGHGPDRVQEVGVHVHVQQVGASPHLLQRNLEGGGVVVVLDQPPEARRPGHVGPLPDGHEGAVGADLEGLQAAEAGTPHRVRDLAGGQPADRLADRRDVLWPGPAAASHQVHEATAGEVAKQPAGRVGLLVVAAERVGQAGVGIAGHEGGHDAR